MWDNPYFSTEFALLKSIGIPLKRKGNMIVESKLFPGYFGGNLLIINKEETSDLAYFEGLFDQFFTSPKTKHKTFYVTPELKNYTALIQAAKEKQYDITKMCYMSRVASSIQPSVPSDLRIDPLDLLYNHTDIEDYLEQIKASNDLEWFWKEGFRKQQAVTEALDIKWFGIRRTGNPQILSSLGVFKFGEFARLQEVKTHPEFYRRGYATLLLNHVITYANDVFNAKEVVLQTDSAYHAFDLYTKLGFISVFEMTELMKS